MSSDIPPLPPWRKKEAVELWANAILDERTLSDFQARQSGALVVSERYEHLMRALSIKEAIGRRDIDGLIELTATVEARRMAFEAFLPSPRGRPSGSGPQAAEIEDAAYQADCLMDAFTEHYGKKRGTRDLAEEIVAKRCSSVSKAQIRQFRHDHPRRDRTNSAI